MAGNPPNFEEASRVLDADDPAALRRLIADWPRDFRGYLERLLERLQSA